MEIRKYQKRSMQIYYFSLDGHQRAHKQEIASLAVNNNESQNYKNGITTSLESKLELITFLNIHTSVTMQWNRRYHF